MIILGAAYRATIIADSPYDAENVRIKK